MGRTHLVLAAALAVLGCDSGMTTPPEPDGGDTPDATTGGCRSAADCDDGAFCNGAERCAPADPDADDDGCAPPTAGACMPTQTCDESSDECLTECDVESDADGDGADARDCGGNDCDDANPRRFPGGTEICDADDEDEDCDPTTFGFRDADTDAHPDARCCNVDTDGTMACGDDCNDARPDIHGGLAESCDGGDNDCDGATDEGVLRTFFVDADGDSFGDESMAPVMACTPPAGHSETGRDCDDTRASVSPVSPEICDVARLDENCDGTANPDTLCRCEGDISRACELPGRCMAGTERCVGGSWGACSIAPISEICNDEDDDCDGRFDEGTNVVCYDDSDDDGFPPPGALETTVCPAPGRGAVGGCPIGLTNMPPVGVAIDCNDGTPVAHPGATEVCDAARLDENCDGMANPNPPCACSGVETRPCVAPGRCAAGTETCASGAFGACSIAAIAELCNAEDDDCDGTVDETTTVRCYGDVDDDGYAPAGATPSTVCPVPGRGAVGGCPLGLTNREPLGTAIDCDDTRPGTRPGATELCDAARIDEDCDGAANPMSLCACSGVETRACPQPGRCASGTQTCASGAWAACTLSPETETCNGVDDDCDGTVDDGVTITCYADVDDDSYSPGGAAMQVCAASGRGAVGGCPIGLTNRAPAAGTTDCNDASTSASPAGTEICDAARVDENCDGVANPMPLCACSGTETRACPQPGQCASGIQTCSSGAWGACSISPEVEGCNATDDDCDGTIDEGTTVVCYVDGDNDTYSPGGGPMSVCPVPGRASVGGCPTGLTNRVAGAGTTDCADASSTIYPGAPESCVGSVDDDCDGAVNEGCSCTIGEPSRPCMRLGVCAMGTETCSGMPPAWVCDRAPGAESCNAADDDCDGATDEGTQVRCWIDDDRDSYAAAGASSTLACACPVGTTTRDPATAADCDDSRDTRNPGATETCNLLDDDCDPSIDETVAVVTVYTDSDGDMRRGTPLMRCRLPTDTITTEDCNETRTDTYVGATELCDRRDNNCSSGGGVDATEDFDMDGHAATANACSGGSLPKDDCQDMAAAIYAGAPELCDRLDNDCSSGGGTDAAEDPDGDSHSPPSSACNGGFLEDDCNEMRTDTYGGAPELCDRRDNNCSSGGGVDTAEDFDNDMHAPTGATCSGGFLRDDCVDTVATTYTGATELCNRVDDNCSSGGGVDTLEDPDNDGHSPPASACMGGFLEDDCNETRADTYTGATELCDRRDNNCSSGGGTDTAEDFDGDMHTLSTYTLCNGGFARDDCNDTSSAIRPGVPETCNGIDDNCNASIDEGVQTTYYRDVDGDSYGGSMIMAACSMPVGYVSNGLDCDDASSMRYPGAPEYCDPVDQSCDGAAFNGCPSGVATTGSPTYGPYYGGASGTPFTDACGSPRLLTGFDVWATSTAVQGIRPRCQTVSIQSVMDTPQYEYNLRDTTSFLGTVHGSMTGTMTTLSCPAGSPFVYAIYGRSGTGINGFGIFCMALQWSGGASEPPPWTPYYPNTYYEVADVGGPAGTDFEHRCTSPQLGRSLRGRTSGNLAAVSLGCSVVGYVPQ